jgi:UDP-glucose 4-epimerase
MSKILVTGIAGYIGSTVGNLLLQAGHQVVGLDNLSTGFEGFIPKEVEFIEGDVTEFEVMNKLGKEVDAVIHLAGIKYAGQSFLDPDSFYRINTVGTLNAGVAAKNSRLRIIIFSSSCSVYGNLLGPIATEESTTNPVSPYGKSKLMAETILNDYVNVFGLKLVSLRYFNVVGASTSGAHDRSEFNLFPNLCRSFINSTIFKVFGSKLATRDGTCIRDYVDVNDIASAHALAFEKLVEGIDLKDKYNLGYGSGKTVMEIINLFSEITQKELAIEFLEARAGDPISIISKYDAALNDFGWSPKFNVMESIKSQINHFHI